MKNLTIDTGYANLAEGIFLFFVSLIVLQKIYKGSKAEFAYTLIIFTAGYSVNGFLWYFYFGRDRTSFHF